jgi:hypothetical protein
MPGGGYAGTAATASPLIPLRGAMLKNDHLEHLNVDPVEHKYSLKYLSKWGHKWRHHAIETLRTFRRMRRDYILITVAGALKMNAIIDLMEYDREFWKGLHQSFRKKVTMRLEIEFQTAI